MATKKKYYGVKKGKKTGIFESWEACKASVNGFPGAEFKGFATLKEVQEYLGRKDADNAGVETPAEAVNESAEVVKETAEVVKAPVGAAKGPVETAEVVKAPAETAKEPEICTDERTLLAYVDGSYEDSIKKYAFGCVFILHDGRVFVEYGNGDNPQSLQHRNVTGEMLGAMYAVRTAMMNGYHAVEICYDYQGIEKWVTGEWRSKTELTQKYARSMQEWSKSIRMKFTKVAAHSNIKYNELADQMAKKGLTEGNGIPKVKKIEEMKAYGTDTTQ